MFTSSPALSALEHAVYDVNLLDARRRMITARGVR